MRITLPVLLGICMSCLQQSSPSIALVKAPALESYRSRAGASFCKYLRALTRCVRFPSTILRFPVCIYVKHGGLSAGWVLHISSNARFAFRISAPTPFPHRALRQPRIAHPSGKQLAHVDIAEVDSGGAVHEPADHRVRLDIAPPRAYRARPPARTACTVRSFGRCGAPWSVRARSAWRCCRPRAARGGLIFSGSWRRTSLLPRARRFHQKVRQPDAARAPAHHAGLLGLRPLRHVLRG